MDFGSLDRLARQTSPLHRATPVSKLLGTGLAMTGVVTSLAPHRLLAVLGLWLLLMAGSRLPVARLLALSGYAALFAASYSLLSGDASELGLRVLKASTTALITLTLLATTPYPRIFQPLRPLLPDPLFLSLLLTYRSLFMLLHRWDHLFAALRIRGGVRRGHPWQTFVNAGPSLGMLILDALDRSQALYDAMLLRGYRGRLIFRHDPLVNGWSWLPLAAGSLTVALLRWPW